MALAATLSSTGSPSLKIDPGLIHVATAEAILLELIPAMLGPMLANAKFLHFLLRLNIDWLLLVINNILFDYD